MSDFLIQLTQVSDDVFFFDLKTASQDLVTDDGLRTATIISLFSDQRVDPDSLPPGEIDQKGWWGDEFLENSQDQIGSKIWTLSREKRTKSVQSRAEQYAKDALQWMIDDGVARSIEVSFAFNAQGYGLWEIEIHRPFGKPVTVKFSNAWDAELNRITG